VRFQAKRQDRNADEEHRDQTHNLSQQQHQQQQQQMG
jgi:hypothetical protein